jgi:hypothetical protein
LAAAKGFRFLRSAVTEFEDGQLTSQTLIDRRGGLDGDGQPRRSQEPGRGQYHADGDSILIGETL